MYTLASDNHRVDIGKKLAKLKLIEVTSAYGKVESQIVLLKSIEVDNIT